MSEPYDNLKDAYLLPLSNHDLFGSRGMGLFWKLGQLHKRFNAALKTEPDRIFQWIYDSPYTSVNYITIMFLGTSGLWVHVKFDRGDVSAEVFGINYHYESGRNVEPKDLENIAKALVRKSFKGELKARPFYEVRAEQKKAEDEADARYQKYLKEQEAQQQL
jgi:hypothetical protein